MEDRHSVAAEIHPDETIPFDEHDFVPHFQRVSISGEDTSGVPLEDLEKASTLIQEALKLRERYMEQSYQGFPQTTARFLKTVHESGYNVNDFEHGDLTSTEGKEIYFITSLIYLGDNICT